MMDQHHPEDRDPHDECRFEIMRLQDANEKFAAEINRRRGMMAVARDALKEAGVPAERDGITLTMSQRIRQLDESRARLLAVCDAIVEEMEDRYDGCPDSKTLWMGKHLDDIKRALRQVTQ